MQYDDVIIELVSLGLSRREAKVYYALLQKESFTATELSKLAGTPRTKIYEIIKGLTAKGLCREQKQKNSMIYTSVDLEIAIPEIIRIKQDELQKIEHRAENLKSFLSAEYQKNSRKDTQLDYIRTLMAKAEIANCYSTYRKRVKKELLEFTKPPFAMSPDQCDAENRINREMVERGVEIRILHERSRLEETTNRQFISDTADAGVEPRFVERLPMKMAIFDDSSVIFSLKDPITFEPTTTSLFVEHPDFVLALKKSFEKYWDETESIETALEKFV